MIFVYIVGRNNSLLYHIEGGFMSGSTFRIYVLCSLAVIQIWNCSTFYINMHGRNGLRDHIGLSVVYVFSVFWQIRCFSRQKKRRREAGA